MAQINGRPGPDPIPKLSRMVSKEVREMLKEAMFRKGATNLALKGDRSLRWVEKWMGPQQRRIPAAVARELYENAARANAISATEMLGGYLVIGLNGRKPGWNTRRRPLIIALPGSSPVVSAMMSGEIAAEICKNVSGVSAKQKAAVAQASKRAVERSLKRFEAIFETKIGQQFRDHLNTWEFADSAESLFAGSPHIAIMDREIQKGGDHEQMRRFLRLILEFVPEVAYLEKVSAEALTQK